MKELNKATINDIRNKRTDKTIETLESIKENNFIMKTWKSKYSKEEMFISKILKLETFIMYKSNYVIKKYS